MLFDILRNHHSQSRLRSNSHHIGSSLSTREGDKYVGILIEHLPVALWTSATTKPPPVGRTNKNLDPALLGPISSQPISAACIAVNQKRESVFFVRAVECVN